MVHKDPFALQGLMRSPKETKVTLPTIELLPSPPAQVQEEARGGSQTEQAGKAHGSYRMHLFDDPGPFGQVHPVSGPQFTPSRGGGICWLLSNFSS